MLVAILTASMGGHMLPYSDYKKSRLIFETFALIKSGQVTTEKEIYCGTGRNYGIA